MAYLDGKGSPQVSNKSMLESEISTMAARKDYHLMKAAVDWRVTHLWHGDLEHKHSTEPTTMGLPVELGQSSLKWVAQPVDWIHIPPSPTQTDSVYLAPLRSEPCDWRC